MLLQRELIMHMNAHNLINDFRDCIYLMYCVIFVLFAVDNKARNTVLLLGTSRSCMGLCY